MAISKMENMRLFFKGVSIDDRTEEYVTKRIQNIEKMLNNIIRVEVEIDLDKKGKFRVEVMIKTPHDLYRAEETTESIEGSTDIVEDELKKQIRRNKDKVQTLRKRGGRSIKKNAVIDEDSRF
ncbi:ribosome hibernation-promoting factor, HPF/YfiA family [Patescibacteria group bacterium]